MTPPIRFRGALESLSAPDRGALLDRSDADGSAEVVAAQVREIIAAVRRDGDAALRRLTERFDEVALERFEVPGSIVRQALDDTPFDLVLALERARVNLQRAHAAWSPDAQRVETEPGILLQRMPSPVARVGIYAPGGRAAYPSSVLMGAVPARVAGVGETILVSPPGPDGLPSRIVMAAAAVAGVDRVFALGGAQAIAALAWGTETVPAVDRIVGPGNVWVTEAKRQVFARTPIDTPAGPSELLVVAGPDDAPAAAAEMVAQAEHDPEAAVVALVVGDRAATDRLEAALSEATAVAERRDVVAAALRNRGAVLSVTDLEAALAFSNEFGPEHLLLLAPDAVSGRFRFWNAGTVFVGAPSSVSFGDYLTGGNHVLPTGGMSRRCSGLGPEAFVRWTTYQTVTEEAAGRLAPDVELLALAEGLPGHAAAARRWRTA
ncbi:MAG: histidinol dehydrogenase [Gemmatimonadales bacterium]